MQRIYAYIEPTYGSTYVLFLLFFWQLNNGSLALWIFSSVLLRRCVTPHLRRKKHQALKISPINTNLFIYFFFFNQGSWEVEEDIVTAQKMIPVSESSRHRLGSCQGTKRSSFSLGIRQEIQQNHQHACCADGKHQRHCFTFPPAFLQVKGGYRIFRGYY